MKPRDILKVGLTGIVRDEEKTRVLMMTPRFLASEGMTMLFFETGKKREMILGVEIVL